MSSRNKKNSESDSRKLQNRLAQREFRQRKQKERDELLAKIELLEKDPSHQSLMTNVARELYAENNRLRALVQSLSTFIGQGAGGTSLDNIGLNRNQVESLISYSQFDKEIDIGFEMFVKNKSKEHNDVDNDNGPSKRLKLDNMKITPNSASDQNILQRNTDATSNLQNLLSSNLSSHSQPQSQPFINSPSTTISNMVSSDTNSNHNIGNNMICNNTGESDDLKLSRFANSLKQYSSNKIIQAAQLIEYNLYNFGLDTNYHLPSSLKPTLVQRTVPHDPIIDGLPFANMRDKLILQEGKVDLNKIATILVTTTTIHGEDVLNCENWEIGEEFCKEFSFLLDEPILNIVNKWRKERGEYLLDLDELQLVNDEEEEVNELSSYPL